MKTILLFFALCAIAAAQPAASPIQAGATKSAVTELGLTFPIKNTLIKSYVDSNGLRALPLTSGYSNGVQVGRHAVVSNKATVGAIVGANLFLGSDSVFITQVYQMNIYVTGRVYFDTSWRGGFFLEVGSGPELSAAKFRGAPLVFQVNIGARFGAGYNYQFSDDVTIGVSVLAAPTLSASNIADGAKVVVSMLW